jgi:hypothetical protein
MGTLAMSEKKSDSASAIGFVVHVLLVVGLLLTLLGAYTAFVILPSEWTNGRGEAARASDAVELDLLDTPRTGAAQPPLLYSGMPDWRTVVHLENTEEIRPDLVITATDFGDSLLAVDEFSAKIVLAGDEAQVLPGVAFVAEKPGRYVARRIALPENGEWELRASLRRGHQTLLVGQKISALLPQTKE